MFKARGALVSFFFVIKSWRILTIMIFNVRGAWVRVVFLGKMLDKFDNYYF